MEVDSLPMELEAPSVISSSALAVQQSEMKMDMLHSLLDARAHVSLKVMEGILDEKKAAIVTRSLASSKTLSKSFDMYLQNVCFVYCSYVLSLLVLYIDLRYIMVVESDVVNVGMVCHMTVT